ncbi:hypothetical protein HMPREF0880_03834 [Yokenella regensburgei ATCC 43003]|nr:hypothetical protein HMPREF0880_03834 [Yokenella regensburgei ATCC 43003]
MQVERDKKRINIIKKYSTKNQQTTLSLITSSATVCRLKDALPAYRQINSSRME